MKYFRSNQKGLRGSGRMLTQTSFRAFSVTILLLGFGLVSDVFQSNSHMASALTTIPTKMNFQGRLTDASGNTKPNGTYNMKLRLFTMSSGSSAVWTEDRLVSAGQGVAVTNGLFAIRLGDVTSLPANLFASGELYLEVELATPASATSASPVWTEGPMTPRNQMAASAYAYNAETLDGIDSSSFAQMGANNVFSATQTVNISSTAAFGVQNGSSASVFRVDTVASKVTVGIADANGTVFVLDTKDTAGDPTGENGASYYNSNTGKFRCYEAGAWKDCDTGGSVSSGTTAQRPGSSAEGTQFYDTTVKQLLVYANGKWQADRTSVSKIVAASNSTQAEKDSADFVVSGADEAAGNADATIASAIAALPGTGGTVYLLGGTYTIDTGIVLPSNITFAGAGMGATIIKVKGALNVDIYALDTSLNVNKTNIVIEDMRIDGNKSNQTAGTQTGIYGYKVGAGTGTGATTGLTIRNVETRDFRTYGVHMLYSENGTVEGIAARGNTVGIYFDTDSRRTTVTNAESTGNTLHGIQVYNSQYIKVQNSKFVQNSGHGIYLNGTNTSSNSFVGNTVTSNTGRGAYIMYGYATKFTDNYVSSNGDDGIVLDGGINPAFAGIVIGNNTINSNTGNGIEADRHVANATITGNRIFNNTAYGVILSGYLGSENPKDNTIVSNYIYTNTLGGITLSQADDNLVQSNTVSNNGGATLNDGIRITGTNSSNNNVSGNVMSDTSCTTNCYSILISGAVGTYVSDNTLGGGTIFDSGTGTRFANQIDPNGNLTNRSVAGFSINTTTTTSSLSLQGGLTNTQLPAPGQPNVTRSGVSGSSTYGYMITALDGTGETLPSPERTYAASNAVLSVTNFNVITWSHVPGAVQYKIYRTTSNGSPATLGLIGTVSTGATLAFNDTGIVATSAVPGSNTTGGMSIAGAMQGSSASLSGALTVTGQATLNGGLTATNTVLFKNSSNSTSAFEIQNSSSVALLTANTTSMTVTVRSLAVAMNLTVNGHIIGGGSTPTVGLGISCPDLGPSSTVTVTGTDTAGKITLTVAPGEQCEDPGSGGEIVSLTFTTAYGAAPYVTLTEGERFDNDIKVGAWATTTGLYIVAPTANRYTTPVVPPGAAGTSVYTWYYHVIQ